MIGWWTWGKHDAAEEAEPAAEPVKKKRLKPGVTFTDPKHAEHGIFWHAVANGRIVADGGEGYSSKQKAEQGLRAAAKVLAAYVAKLDAKKARKRG